MNSKLKNIPKYWEWVTLDDIGIIVSGGTPSTKEPEFWNGEIPWITPADLSDHNEIYISKGSRNISQAGLEYSSAHLLPANSVVFSSRAPIGYVAITKNELATNQGFKNLVLPNELVNPKYVYYYLKTIKELAENLASGTTFLELSTTKFRQIPFPLAPIEEQNLIVEKIEEVLSYINESLNQINKSLIKTELYLRKCIYNIFKGSLLQNDYLLNELPNEWEWKTLDEIGKIYNGGTPKTEIKEYWGDEIAWITPSDLSNSKEKYISKGKKSITKLGLDNSSTKKLPKETIIFSTRAPIGYVAIAKNELTINQGFKAIVVNEKINSSYIYYYLKSINEYANKIASGTTFLELSMEKFKSIPIPIPPFEEQNQIVIQIENILEDTNNLTNELHLQKMKIVNSKEKILQEAFQGKLIIGNNKSNSVKSYVEKLKTENDKYLFNHLKTYKIKRSVRRERKNLLNILALNFNNNSFYFEDIIQKSGMSIDALEEEFNSLMKNGKISKIYDKKSKSIKFKIS
ncbi:MAG: restriction endonuclease subunit S [Bacteroidetes bacterium]|uniref:restriction endonuclease subunit S n=1 Tax=Flavobacterium sp. TaxID=239 RepID=UPI002FDB556B|nr:restriction endonuclease subunit S [Bacteroidota bacterium]